MSFEAFLLKGWEKSTRIVWPPRLKSQFLVQQQFFWSCCIFRQCRLKFRGVPPGHPWGIFANYVSIATVDEILDFWKNLIISHWKQVFAWIKSVIITTDTWSTFSMHKHFGTRARSPRKVKVKWNFALFLIDFDLYYELWRQVMRSDIYITAIYMFRINLQVFFFHFVYM
jgi:hypothetical protein